MYKTIAWFAENRVAANLLMVLILISGVISIPLIKKEVLPDISWGTFTVTVTYPGASPTEIENSVVSKIEPLLQSIDGITNVYVFIRPNVVFFNLEVAAYSKEAFDKISEDIAERLERVTGLPKGAGEPKFRQIELSGLVGSLVIYGDASERALKNLANTIRDDLISSGEITKVHKNRSKPYEISVEVDELAMQRYGILFPELARAIASRSQSIASGVVDTNDGRVSILTKTPIKTKEDIEDLYVRSYADGARIKVSDVARVVDGFKESDARIGEFNGHPAAYLAVYRTGNQNISEVADALRKYIENPRVFIPEGISLAIWQDMSVYYSSRVDLLLENAVNGLLILCGILLLFLNLRLSFWVGIGIPVAFLGAFGVLLYTGGSINMVSLFAFILVLGIVVDDAIIVGENIYTHQSKGLPLGKSRLECAISGASQVASPVIFAVLTTIVMFVPMLYLPGPEGQLVRAIPIVVIAILIFSLIESLLILPAHLSSGRSNASNKVLPSFGLQKKFSEFFSNFVNTKVRSFLNFILRWRYSSQAFFVGIFLICLALLQGGWLKMALFSTIEADYSVADLKMPIGTPFHETEKAVKQIELAAIKLKAQLHKEGGGEQIKNIVTYYGQGGKNKGSHIGQVIIELEPSDDRETEGMALNRRWRDLVGYIPDAVELTFDSTLNKPGPAIDLRLTSVDTEKLKIVSKEIREVLAKYDGVYDIREGKQREQYEIHLEPKAVAADLGINMDEIATQVRNAFYGLDVMSLRRDGEEVKVKLKYPADYNGSLWNLENMQILLPSGAVVPLANIAEIRYALGPSVIRRTDGRRSLQISAYVDEDIASSEQIMRDLRSKDGYLSTLQSRFTGIDWSPSGLQKTRKDFLVRLLNLYFIALIVMYAIMAVLFKSYFQPFLVLYAVPFGLLGAVLGHLMMGLELTLWSLVGMCAVSGVVVNDNLVLVDYINRQLKSGVALKQAILDSSVSRFRPIILTTLTTFFGLMPLMFETSVQAKFLIPMAVSLGFGVVFATLVTLILVPATYYIMGDIMKLFKRKSMPQHEVSSANVDQSDQPRKPKTLVPPIVEPEL